MLGGVAVLYRRKSRFELLPTRCDALFGVVVALNLLFAHRFITGSPTTSAVASSRTLSMSPFALVAVGVGGDGKNYASTSWSSR